MRRAVAATALALLAPAAAQAATVRVYVPPCAPEQSKYGQCYPDEARFVAAPGEQNKITVDASNDARTYSPTVTFTDAGAPLTAGAGCTQVDAHSASCTGYSVIAVVSAGDGDDTVSGPAAIVDGGPGDDTLTGGSTERGGPGDDTLRAGDHGSLLEGDAGHDTIAGNVGNDTIVDAANAGEQDVVDGGDGVDTMSYSGRQAGVTVSLQQPLAGEDRLSSIESLTGGNGNDHLTGDAGPNTLDGGPGRDLLAGGEGDDVLAGGAGADALQGGPGDDKLDPGDDNARNAIGCGTGQDRADPHPNTLIGPDCEIVGLDDFDLNGVLRLHLPLRTTTAPLVTFASRGCIELPCSVRMTVMAKRRTIGFVRVVQRRSRPRLPKLIGLRLSPAGARMLKGSGPLDARVQITVVDGGERSTAGFRIPLAAHAVARSAQSYFVRNL